jgi:RimJ/RimL family protein N-acetyltransferase
MYNQGMKEKITIRPLRLSDVDSCLSMVNSLVKERAMVSIQKKLTRKQEEERIKKTLKEIEGKKCLTFVIDIDGKVAGISSISKLIEGARRHVGDMGIFLRKDVRGKGLGEKLFRKSMREGIKKFKFKILHLTIFKDNKIAMNLYKKLGFVKIGTIKKGLRYFNGYQDLIIMVKYL